LTQVVHMTHLRTDLSLIPDQEMNDWIEDILENTHYRDIKVLNQKLGEAIKSHDTETTHETMTKSCDKCNKMYPEYIDQCDCGNSNLEMFQVHYNAV
jgi:hypothetical protein